MAYCQELLTFRMLKMDMRGAFKQHEVKKNWRRNPTHCESRWHVRRSEWHHLVCNLVRVNHKLKLEEMTTFCEGREPENSAEFSGAGNKTLAADYKHRSIRPRLLNNTSANWRTRSAALRMMLRRPPVKQYIALWRAAVCLCLAFGKREKDPELAIRLLFASSNSVRRRRFDALEFGVPTFRSAAAVRVALINWSGAPLTSN